MKEMPVSYHRILMRLEQKEQRMLRRTSPAPFAAPMEKFRARIPYAVQYNLERAFEKAFSLLFSPEGKRFLEHTYAKRTLEENASRWERPLSPSQARKALAQLNRSAGLTAAVSPAERVSWDRALRAWAGERGRSQRWALSSRERLA